jgi:signal recognition particle receptor subunit beta
VSPDAAAKIVLAGPVGAGKTSAIRAISDGEALSTEMPWSDPAQPGKSTTTVALDFAHIVLDDGTPVLVYGLPGQDHFAFMRPIVLEGAIGAIILLDGRDAELATRCESWLRSVADIAPAAAIAIGVTHTDLVPGFSIAPVRTAARCLGRPVPVFTLDARDRSQARQLARAMVAAA